MKNEISPRTVLLASLGHGPATASDLLERLEKLTGGDVRMAPGTFYPYIRELQDGALVKGSPVANPDPSSRIKTTTEYSLTKNGEAQLKAIRSSLLALFDGGGKSKASKAGKKSTRKAANAKKSKAAQKANGKANGHARPKRGGKKARKATKKATPARVKSIPAPAADPSSGAVA